MADVAVTPAHLDRLATAQDQASTQAGTAASAASGLETEVWVSHGVVSWYSNLAFTKAANARKSTGDAMSKSSTELADKLRTAKKVYASTDQQAGEAIDKQVLES
ncbi:ESX-1 secretion-associated protein [Mycobacterium sp. SMC-2]|uniref:ESX-1 secretion-associated protein n=1 Tax=Mycobacterium sp. SMC-2 TaxID=2857058 RepID=UPI0021B171BC|nr:ESX-1 secretion-associated protein [Mycobacterium sp. SMC-2]UXA07113.1 ESX-1 secretion-associated protein [Mycobacterium sp. SMC-2]